MVKEKRRAKRVEVVPFMERLYREWDDELDR